MGVFNNDGSFKKAKPFEFPMPLEADSQLTRSKRNNRRIRRQEDKLRRLEIRLNNESIHKSRIYRQKVERNK